MADLSPHSAAGRPRLDRALDLVRFLRAHCPWAAAQTPSTLLPYLLEEAHEVADAVAEEDDDALPGELGDLLLNLAFQIVLAEERGAFDAETVASRLEAKMRRRHPHLYGGEAEPWETLKARERGDRPVLDGLTRRLDPLARPPHPGTRQLRRLRLGGRARRLREGRRRAGGSARSDGGRRAGRARGGAGRPAVRRRQPHPARGRPRHERAPAREP